MSTAAPAREALELQEYALAVVVVLLFVVGAILKPDTFPTIDNIRNMLTQASVVGRARDRHDVRDRDRRHRPVGRLDGRRGRRLRRHPRRRRAASSLVFILGAVGVRDGCSATVNAIAIAYGRVVPFIATLAMFSIAQGLALLLNDKLPVGLLDLNGGSFGEPGAFSLLWFGTGRIVGIPVSVYVFLAITIAGWVLLNRTRYGRYVVAVGGNREAARIAGVPVRKMIFSVYVLWPACSPASPRCCCARGSGAPRRSAATSTSSTRSAPS